MNHLMSFGKRIHEILTSVKVSDIANISEDFLLPLPSHYLSLPPTTRSKCNLVYIIID